MPSCYRFLRSNIEETARESASVALRLVDLRTARLELSTLAMSDQLPSGLSKGRRGGKEQEAGPETTQQEAYQALADLLTASSFLEALITFHVWFTTSSSSPPL